MMSVVHSRLEHTSFKAEHFSGHVNDVCHSVSGIYQDTLSKLRFRIKVSGSAQHLQDGVNADIIRALLLAGIRSAFLWRQLGGSSLATLVLERKRILQSQPATVPRPSCGVKSAPFAHLRSHSWTSQHSQQFPL